MSAKPSLTAPAGCAGGGFRHGRKPARNHWLVNSTGRSFLQHLLVHNHMGVTPASGTKIAGATNPYTAHRADQRNNLLLCGNSGERQWRINCIITRQAVPHRVRQHRQGSPSHRETARKPLPGPQSQASIYYNIYWSTTSA
ncbi:MAG: hypothetical protein MZU91_01635 [Desulfosudis oleivorans]|nr:hypothetical protein [Desulfosudis oleivorans]